MGLKKHKKNKKALYKFFFRFYGGDGTFYILMCYLTDLALRVRHTIKH